MTGWHDLGIVRLHLDGGVEEAEVVLQQLCCLFQYLIAGDAVICANKQVKTEQINTGVILSISLNKMW